MQREQSIFPGSGSVFVDRIAVAHFVVRGTRPSGSRCAERRVARIGGAAPGYVLDAIYHQASHGAYRGRRLGDQLIRLAFEYRYDPPSQTTGARALIRDVPNRMACR